MAAVLGTFSDVVVRLRAAGCVFAEEEAQLLLAEASTSSELHDMVEQRVAGLPIEQIVGWVEFCGLRIALEPGVFVPRRRTEALVHEALAVVQSVGRRERLIVVDLCCGSGALGAALAAALGDVEVYAVDIDAASVRCAGRNLAQWNAQVYEGDLDAPLPDALVGRVDLLVANVPYVPTPELGLMPPEARLHEPRVALDGGADGLDVLRRVAQIAPRWLAPGGHLLIETSERQSEAVADAFVDAGLVARVAESEKFDATVVIGATAAADSAE